MNEILKDRRIRLAQLGDHPAIALAVEEISRYLKIMDPGLGVDILVAPQMMVNCGWVIWVGLCEEGKKLLPAIRDAELDDAIAVEVSDNAGFITGSNPRSVLMAAYRFLKRLGCAWVRPGPDGERIPEKKIENIAVSLRDQADRRHRGICIEGAVSYENVRDMIEFLPKVGMNTYFVQFFAPFIFFDRWYDHQGSGSDGNPYLKKEQITRELVDGMTLSLEKEISRRGLCYHKVGHGWTCEPFGVEGMGWYADKVYDIPEETQGFLAQLDGKRQLFHNVPLNTNLCYSNPIVREKMTQAICDYCAENPQVDVVHFWLADGRNNQCECEDCRKKRPSDWFIDLLNELDEKMTAAGVKTRVVFLVYVDLLWAPEQGKLKNPDRFILMFAPITRSYAHSYGQSLSYETELPPYIRNELDMPSSLAENLAHLRNWQKGFAGDGFSFDYHLWCAHMSDFGYEKCARNLFNDMQDLPKIGLDGMVSCQVQRSFFPTGLPLYMMAAALWDEKADFEEKAAEYYQAAYGSDGEKVHRILSAVSSLVYLYDSPSSLYRWPQDTPCCRDMDALKQAADDLALLLENHREDDLTCGEWVLLGYYHQYLSMVHRLLTVWEKQDQPAVNTAFKELMDYLWKNEIILQSSLDVQSVERSLKRKLGIE